MCLARLVWLVWLVWLVRLMGDGAGVMVGVAVAAVIAVNADGETAKTDRKTVSCRTARK